MQTVQEMMNQKKTKMTNSYIIAHDKEPGHSYIKGKGFSSKILNRTSERYQSPVLWVGLGYFHS